LALGCVAGLTFLGIDRFARRGITRGLQREAAGNYEAECGHCDKTDS
jgi:hypothetical protein